MRCHNVIVAIALYGVISGTAVTFADTYDFKDGESRTVRFVESEGPMFRINTSEFPNHDFPVYIERTFVHYIDKVRLSEPLLQKTLDDSVKLLEQGNNYYFKRDYRNAIRLYQDALRINPDYRFAYNNLAVCHFMLAEYRQCIDWAGKLLNVDGLNGHAYFYRGLSYIRLENYIRAYDDIRAAKIIFEKQNDISEIAVCEELLEKLALRNFPY
jgi:tetratricopeptide (TPR) repeat protein